MRLTATIGGTTRAPLLKGSNLSLSMEQRVWTANLRFILDDPTVISTHATVTIQDDTPTTIFSGFVVGLDISKAKHASKFYVLARCASTAWLLDNPPALVTKVYRNIDDQDIILDALSEAGLTGDITASTSTIDTVESGMSIAFRERSMREVLEDVSSYSGAVWNIDASDTLKYEAEANSTAAAWDINQDAPNNSTTYAVQDFKLSKHFEKPVTDAVVLGAIGPTGSQISATASASSPPRTFTRSFESPLIVTDAMAQAVADAIIATRQTESDSASFTFLDEDGRAALVPNTLVDITSSDLGLSADTFLVRTVQIQQITGEISEFKVTAGGFAPSQAELLRKIEAGSRRSQQSLPFIFSCYNFNDATPEWAKVPDHSSLQTLDPITISFWTMLDDNAADCTFVIKSSNTGGGWRVKMDNSGGGSPTTKVSARRRHSISDINLLSSSSLATATLYHIAVIFNSTSGIVYINGESDGTASGSGSVTSDTGLDIEIGYNNTADAAGAPTEALDGIMADLRIWNVALPPNMIRRLASRPGAEPDLYSQELVLHLRMDEYGPGETVSSSAGGIRDSSPQMNHGQAAVAANPDGREEVWQ